MPSSTAPRTLERARPLLGTIVSIALSGTDEAAGHAAISAAFAEITAIHMLMSFQEPGSELNRIARDAVRARCAIDSRTRACLGRALHWAEASGGIFDPVRAGGTRGSWRDVALDDASVRLLAPVRIDLSGIAKGFAVDRAAGVLRAAGIDTARIDAGGDLYVIGEAIDVTLRPSARRAPPAMIRIGDGALASSDPAQSLAQGIGRHIDGRDRCAAPAHFVSVAAPSCEDADALTKIVLVAGEAALPLLRSVNAVACRHDGTGWETIGA